MAAVESRAGQSRRSWSGEMAARGKRVVSKQVYPILRRGLRGPALPGAVRETPKPNGWWCPPPPSLILGQNFLWHLLRPTYFSLVPCHGGWRGSNPHPAFPCSRGPPPIPHPCRSGLPRGHLAGGGGAVPPTGTSPLSNPSPGAARRERRKPNSAQAFACCKHVLKKYNLI